LLQKLIFSLALAELIMKVVGSFLLLAGFVANARNFRLDLKNLVLLLVYQLLDGLEGFVTLLHAEK